MKVLVSVHVIWWNASAYYAITVAEALVRRGHEVIVIAHSSTPAFKHARAKNLKTIGDLNLMRKDPYSLIRNVKKLRSLIETEQLDIINPHRPEDHLLLAAANLHQRNPARLVRTVTDVRVPKGNLFNKILHRRFTDGIIYCAEACKTRYHRGFSLDNLPEKVVYSALDVGQFIEGDWKTDNRLLALTSPRIGILARLTHHKGHRTLLEAAVMIRKEIPSATFLVVGKEEDLKIPELQEYALRLGIDDAFVFTGRLDDPRPAIAACDIGVVASHLSEVISRAAQEFFSFGVPVVATRVNVLPEMVEDEVNGILIQPKDATALASAILTLAADEEKRREMGQRAADFAQKRHDLKVLGERTETFFQDVLKD